MRHILRLFLLCMPLVLSPVFGPRFATGGDRLDTGPYGDPSMYVPGLPYGVVAGPPTRPQAASRPSSWPSSTAKPKTDEKKAAASTAIASPGAKPAAKPEVAEPDPAGFSFAEDNSGGGAVPPRTPAPSQGPATGTAGAGGGAVQQPSIQADPSRPLISSSPVGGESIVVQARPPQGPPAISATPPSNSPAAVQSRPADPEPVRLPAVAESSPVNPYQGVMPNDPSLMGRGIGSGIVNSLYPETRPVVPGLDGDRTLTRLPAVLAITQPPPEPNPDPAASYVVVSDAGPAAPSRPGFADAAGPARPGYADAASPARPGFADAVVPARPGFAEVESSPQAAPEMVAGPRPDVSSQPFAESFRAPLGQPSQVVSMPERVSPPAGLLTSPSTAVPPIGPFTLPDRPASPASVAATGETVSAPTSLLTSPDRTSPPFGPFTLPDRPASPASVATTDERVSAPTSLLSSPDKTVPPLGSFLFPDKPATTGELAGPAGRVASPGNLLASPDRVVPPANAVAIGDRATSMGAAGGTVRQPWQQPQPDSALHPRLVPGPRPYDESLPPAVIPLVGTASTADQHGLTMPTSAISTGSQVIVNPYAIPASAADYGTMPGASPAASAESKPTKGAVTQGKERDATLTAFPAVAPGLAGSNANGNVLRNPTVGQTRENTSPSPAGSLQQPKSVEAGYGGGAGPRVVSPTATPSQRGDGSVTPVRNPYMTPPAKSSAVEDPQAQGTARPFVPTEVQAQGAAGAPPSNRPFPSAPEESRGPVTAFPVLPSTGRPQWGSCPPAQAPATTNPAVAPVVSAMPPQPPVTPGMPPQNPAASSLAPRNPAAVAMIAPAASAAGPTSSTRAPVGAAPSSGQLAVGAGRVQMASTATMAAGDANRAFPASFPGAAAAPAGPVAMQAAVSREPVAPGQSPTGDMKPCESAQILARVGSDVILACDMAGAINEMIAKHFKDIPPSQYEAARTQLMRQLLRQQIETKLAYLDARRTIPADNIPKIEKDIGEHFDKQEVERYRKALGVTTDDQLNEKLAAMGTTLERERRMFTERMIARQWVQQKVKFDGDIAHAEMLAYYHEHAAEFTQPAKARWEELMVRFSRHARRDEAYQLIAEMGNRVLKGSPLAQVAKDLSEGPTSSDGGAYGWTTQGSLVSRELDNAIFGLPVGELSQIIEDQQGLHIVRVTERAEATKTPFLEAQVGIREKIKQQKSDEQLRKYIERLRKDTPVWTIFDEQPGSAQQQPQSVSRG